MKTQTADSDILALSQAIKNLGGKITAQASKASTFSPDQVSAFIPDKVGDMIRLGLATGRNIWLYGVHGVGKSTIAEAILGATGEEYLRIQGHSGFDSSDWYGGAEFDEKGNIKIVYSKVVEAAERGVPIIIEEINMVRAENKGPLFSFLDNTPFVDVSINGTMKRVHKKKGFRVIVTANDNGSGQSLHLYNGGDRESLALMSRFLVIKVGYLSPVAEKKMVVDKTGFTNMKLLDDMYHVVRESRKAAEGDTGEPELAISPRNFIDWADLLMAYKGLGMSGMSHLEIARPVLIDRLTEGCEPTVTKFITNKFGLNDVKPEDI